jgi:hypothetical protein
VGPLETFGRNPTRDRGRTFRVTFSSGASPPPHRSKSGMGTHPHRPSGSDSQRRAGESSRKSFADSRGREGGCSSLGGYYTFIRRFYV